MQTMGSRAYEENEMLAFLDQQVNQLHAGLMHPAEWVAALKDAHGVGKGWHRVGRGGQSGWWSFWKAGRDIDHLERLQRDEWVKAAREAERAAEREAERALAGAERNRFAALSLEEVKGGGANPIGEHADATVETAIEDDDIDDGTQWSFLLGDRSQAQLDWAQDESDSSDGDEVDSVIIGPADSSSPLTGQTANANVAPVARKADTPPQWQQALYDQASFLKFYQYRQLPKVPHGNRSLEKLMDNDLLEEAWEFSRAERARVVRFIEAQYKEQVDESTLDDFARLAKLHAKAREDFQEAKAVVSADWKWGGACAWSAATHG